MCLCRGWEPGHHHHNHHQFHHNNLHLYHDNHHIYHNHQYLIFRFIQCVSAEGGNLIIIVISFIIIIIIVIIIISLISKIMIIINIQAYPMCLCRGLERDTASEGSKAEPRFTLL